MSIRTLSTSIMLCLALLTANAQKAATVRSFTQTTDHIPGGERRNDLNGTPCALVKVQVVDNIERVEGNKIGEIVKKGVEKWVYMCKGSRNMRIHLKNHLPVKVMFQDYHINGLESNRVYELVIEIPDASATDYSSGESGMAKQKLVLNYSPSNAMVLVDSKPYKGNGRIELKLPIGDHSYLIAADGYITAEGIVKLNDRAPREIIENLTSENPNAQTAQRQDTPTYTPPQTVLRQDNPTYTPSSKEGQYGRTDPEPVAPRSSNSGVTPPRLLNKSFKCNYEGVTFKCKAKKGYITITGFDVDASNVTIPAQVPFEGNTYPVVEVSTFINGNNYSATRLIIQEGVQRIDNYSFMEFRKLAEVTLPSSIVEIGKNAFRDNSSTRFNLPANISEYDLRAGRSIRIR